MKTLTETEKIKIFEEKISKIHNHEVREFIEKCITKIPDYFFTLPASSTGKYHRFDERGEHGLLLHTFRVCDYIEALERMDEFLITEYNHDCLIGAAILHDCMKYGNGDEPSKHTLFEHPKLAKEFIESIGEDCGKSELAKDIGDIVITHSGQWNKNPYSNIELPKPSILTQKMLHYADYFASKMSNVSLEYIEAIYNQL